MRLKAVVKYNISETKYSILVFYGILAAITVFIGITVNIYSGNIHGSSGGAEMASAIFLFVVGLNSFKQNYLFLSSNGITRKAQFYGFLMSSLTIATVMAAIDTTVGSILTHFINYKTLISMIYARGVIGTSGPLFVLTSFVGCAVLYLFAMTLGYLITTLYYRMSKILKIIFTVGVIVLFFNVLPAIDMAVNNGKLYVWFGEFFISLAGLKNGYNPFMGIISLLVGTAILAGLAYMLVRRAPVKE